MKEPRIVQIIYGIFCAATMLGMLLRHRPLRRARAGGTLRPKALLPAGPGPCRPPGAAQALRRREDT
jgi:hypothetical protein